MHEKKGKALIWLRNDLRIEDQASFYFASNKYNNVIAYYSFDPQFFSKNHWGYNRTESFRAQFLIDTISSLKYQLEKLNITLIIEKRNPIKGLDYWIRKLKIDSLFFQKEWTRDEYETEKNLINVIPSNVSIKTHFDQFLFHPNDVKMEIKQIPEVFTVFRKICEKKINVRSLFPDIVPLKENKLRLKAFSLPSLSDLGLKIKENHSKTAFPFKGGCDEALERLNNYLWKTKKLSFYKKTRNGLLGVDYSSKFSPWLANGSLSPRKIYWEIKRYEKSIQKNQSTYWLIFELIWRDFFKYISMKHRDKIFKLEGILDRNYEWNRSKKLFKTWVEGKTKYPFVNSNMLELKKTGWMSNRGRQNVSSFLAKELKIDWRMGAAYFESMLLDYDVHSNYGNWIYVSGIGNDPRYRKFDIKWQSEKYDPNMKHQNLWLNEN